MPGRRSGGFYFKYKSDIKLVAGCRNNARDVFHQNVVNKLLSYNPLLTEVASVLRFIYNNNGCLI